jgi:Beta-galactosidase/beta-glucuronidase
MRSSTNVPRLRGLAAGVGAAGRLFEIRKAAGIPYLWENGLPYPSFFDRAERTAIPLDGQWRSRVDPEDSGRAEAWQASDTGAWEQVIVPSTLNAAVSQRSDYCGVAWYERDFELPEPLDGRLARLGLEGVLMRCEAWLNGQRLGSREGGYAPFFFDATAASQVGANRLVLRVDSRLTRTSLPPMNWPDMRPGWFPYGGVYRPLRLELLPLPYIFKARASCEFLEDGSAELRVDVLAHGRSGSSCEMRCAISSPGGEGLGRARAIPRAEGDILAASFAFRVEEPKPYSAESPSLYECRIVLESERGRDEVFIKTGLREVKVESDSVLVNGSPVFLRGVCKHEDDPKLGASQDEASIARDLALVRGLGANYLRLAHYPHDAREVAAARDLGIYLSEEVANYQAGMGFAHWFQQKESWRSFPLRDFGSRQVLDRDYLLAVQRELAELIERDANNPAILLWCLGNETYDLGRTGRRIYSWLRATARELDGTRPTTMCEQTYNLPALDRRRRGGAAVDVVSVNLYSGWYYGRASEAAGHLDRIRELFPGKPVIVSEFGADAAPGRRDSDGPWQAERVAAGRTYSEDYQAALLREYWDIARSRPWIVGLSPWVLADFRCTWFPSNPVPNYNLKGLVSRERVQKLGYRALAQLYTQDAEESASHNSSISTNAHISANASASANAPSSTSVRRRAFDFSRFQEELYPRWEAQFARGGTGEFGYLPGAQADSYGTTDTLISRYTMGELELSEKGKDEWAAVINRFQDDDGWYRKSHTNHAREHTTAYATAALTLIGRAPERPFAWAKPILRDGASMEAWIRGPHWSIVWPGSHVTSGVPAALAMTGEGSGDFFDWYFDWLDREADPRTGFWQRGLVHRLRLIRRPTKHEMGGAFHMYYVYERFGRPWLYPERIVDESLRLQHANGLWDKDAPYCIDLDGLYNSIRSSEKAGGYRRGEVREAARRFLAAAEGALNDRDFLFRSYPNTHRLTGALSAIAECARAFPELVRTPRPWRQSLDSAPYI